MLLEGKHAVIYGGGGSIGGAVARAFAREGASDFLAGRTEAALEEVAEDIRAAGGRAETAVVDALDEQAVARLDPTVLSGDPVEETRTLKERPDKDIVATGSITLCHTLIEAGLVDEYRLFVYPVVQGRGRRLFPDGFECPALRLLEAKAFRSGVTYSRYASA